VPSGSNTALPRPEAEKGTFSILFGTGFALWAIGRRAKGCLNKFTPNFICALVFYGVCLKAYGSEGLFRTVIFRRVVQVVSAKRR